VILEAPELGKVGSHDRVHEQEQVVPAPVPAGAAGAGGPHGIARLRMVVFALQRQSGAQQPSRRLNPGSRAGWVAVTFRPRRGSQTKSRGSPGTGIHAIADDTATR